MNKQAEQNLNKRLARRAAEEGMTLIEIMIVLAIIAIVATGVSVALIPQFQKGQIKAAEADVEAIRGAVQIYMAYNPGKCPDAEDLKAEKVLSKDKRTQDPWGNEFVINCPAGDDPEVYSVGPDGQEGSEDDVGRGNRE